MATDLARLHRAEALREELELLWRSTLKAPLPQFVKPWPTLRLLERIHDNSDVTMALSQAVSQVVAQTGAKLAEDETFACMLCVVRKPRYVSEVTGLAPEHLVEDPEPEPFVEDPEPEPFRKDPTPEPAGLERQAALKMAYSGSEEGDFPFWKLHAKAWRSIRYNIVMEPQIMKAVTHRRAEDRIHY